MAQGCVIRLALYMSLSMTCVRHSLMSRILFKENAVLYQYRAWRRGFIPGLSDGS